MKKRVVVAMSGGVDSSVAAALLVRKGFEVIGITMCFSLIDSRRNKPSCCGLQGIEDARRVADKLNIRHYTVNMQKILNQQVIKDFCIEYSHGRTPNPCVRCNQYIKFGALLNKALVLDADFLATGHYARKGEIKGKTPRPCLKKGKDRKKDQSYFLYRLNQEQLKRIIFPLGEYTKEEVRGLAREFGLPVAQKPASQEICFITDNNYRAFLKGRVSKGIEPGPVMDGEGNILGQHKGIAFYTLGQREGLGIARGYPVYITEIDATNNLIIVGRKEDALKRELLVKQPNLFIQPLKKKIVVRVKIRYNHREARAEISPADKKIRVKFSTRQFAATPGQSAVFYKNDLVLGGGIIEAAW